MKRVDNKEKFDWEKKYKTMQEREQFLKILTTALLSTTDISKSLHKVAKYLVPYLGDFCNFSIVNEQNEIERISSYHLDKRKIWLVKKITKLLGKYDPGLGTRHILQTGKPEFVPDNAPNIQMFKEKFPEIYPLAAELNAKSYMGVPIVGSKKTIGVIAIASITRHYTRDDLEFAQLIAERIALVIENKRLHAEAEENVLAFKNRELKLIKESEKKWADLAKENEKLYKKAQRAISIRNDFMSIASHELKTPITSIKMYAQFLKRIFTKSPDKKLVEYFERMDEQVDKMSALIGDLLDISRIEHGKFEVKMGIFSLDKEVEETVQVCQATTKKHQIRIEGKIRKKVCGDRVRISQVLINLLTNAIRYSPGADTIIVKLVPTDSGAFVAVQDFGIGIEHKEVDKLFEPFYRSAGAEKETKSSPGLGIGLYISSQIIKKHGNRIAVESKKGKGSTFSFTLPYA